MTQEKLEKGRELFMAIKDCEHEIKDILQMLETEFKYFYLTGETKHYQPATVKLDEKTFDIFLDKVLNDYKTRLSDLETEFNNL
jgi:hypothetical protein